MPATDPPPGLTQAAAPPACHAPAAAWLLAGLLATAPAQGADDPAQARLRFAPPDGTRFVETVVTTRERAVEGLGRQLDRSETRTRNLVRREGPDTVIAATLESAVVTRNGQPAPGLLERLLQDVTVTFRAGEDGQLKRVTGYDAVLDRLDGTVPREVAAALAAVLSEKALVARETTEWNGRIGFLAGTTVRIGQVLSGETPYTLPNGAQLRYTVLTAFPRWEPCPAGRCLRVEVRYDSDAAALSELVNQTLRDAAGPAGAGGELPAVADAPRLSGSASRLIDPHTMLIYEEMSRREMRMSIDVPGRGRLPSVQREQRSHSYAYQ